MEKDKDNSILATMEPTKFQKSNHFLVKIEIFEQKVKKRDSTIIPESLSVNFSTARMFPGTLNLPTPCTNHQLFQSGISLMAWGPPEGAFFAFHLSCAGKAQSQSHGTVKLHRVFLHSISPSLSPR
ncbi:hypothetical protein M9H77_18947 [Catharanthus roseus]|uniref:Uncharacterized protein n=1 Tax=Catharanthus roseus TaxID=4058 RepID=A0ACC0B8W0_CATRO|nr:hypothetical protein M9H77_18947 [Catharanthus roseus]